MFEFFFEINNNKKRERFIVSKEIEMNVIQKQIQNNIEFEDKLKTKKHFIQKFEDFFFLKEDSLIISSENLPESAIAYMDKINNSNFYEVQAFSINYPSEIPIAFFPDVNIEQKMIPHYFLSLSRNAEVVLA